MLKRTFRTAIPEPLSRMTQIKCSLFANSFLQSRRNMLEALLPRLGEPAMAPGEGGGGEGTSADLRR